MTYPLLLKRQILPKVLSKVLPEALHGVDGGKRSARQGEEGNNVRYPEYVKMVKIKRRLRRKILEDPGPRPAIPEPSLHPVIPGGQAREQCGACDHCKAQDCGRCSSCLKEGLAATGAQDQGREAPEGCESEQRRCMAWKKTHPPSPSS